MQRHDKTTKKNRDRMYEDESMHRKKHVSDGRITRRIKNKMWKG